MDAIELYRQERARKRGGGTKGEAKDRRDRFLDRLSMVRQDLSLRAFADVVGIPHSTIHSWSRDEQSQPTMLHLQAIADRAELPGVPRGMLSVDWLCGLSEEPSRNIRVEAEQLPAQLSAYVAREAIAEAGPAIDAGFRESLRRMILRKGETLVRLLVDMTADEVRANEAGYGARLQLIKKNSPIREALAAADEIDSAQFEQIMRDLYSPPPLPGGKVITWQPTSPPGRPSGKRKAPKRCRP